MDEKLSEFLQLALSKKVSPSSRFFHFLEERKEAETVVSNNDCRNGAPDPVTSSSKGISVKVSCRQVLVMMTVSILRGKLVAVYLDFFLTESGILLARKL